MIKLYSILSDFFFFFFLGGGGGGGGGGLSETHQSTLIKVKHLCQLDISILTESIVNMVSLGKQQINVMSKTHI